MNFVPTLSRPSAIPPAVRALLLLSGVLFLSATTPGIPSANVWYEAALEPLGEEPAGSPDATLYCAFPRQPNRHLPDCLTTEPMELLLSVGEMDGDLTGIVFRLGDAQGETVFRVSSDEQTIPFDEEQCTLLRTWTNMDSEWLTPFYIVIESTTHPEGVLGGPLLMFAGNPTLEQTWGKVKSLYVEGP